MSLQPPTASDVDDAFDAVLQRRRAEALEERQTSQLWHSHHQPHRYERCIVVGNRHICRRCSWFYPIALVVMAANLAGLRLWPETWDTMVLWTLPIPATVHFVAGELGRVAYNPRVQVAVTALMAPAVGRGFALELGARWNPAFWWPCLVFGTVWLAAALIGHVTGSGQYAGPTEASGEGTFDA